MIKSCKEENGEEKGDYDGDDAIYSPGSLGLGCGSRHVEASISSISGATVKTPPHLPARDII